MSKLSANAKPFVPGKQPAKRERPFDNASSSGERSLFMTLSNGAALTWQEIHQHFTNVYGQCVEYVYVHTQPNRDPEFGRIIFTTRELPEMIMGDHETIEVFVRNKPLWLKRYIPQSRRNNNDG